MALASAFPTGPSSVLDHQMPGAGGSDLKVVVLAAGIIFGHVPSAASRDVVDRAAVGSLHLEREPRVEVGAGPGCPKLPGARGINVGLAGSSRGAGIDDGEGWVLRCRSLGRG